MITVAHKTTWNISYPPGWYLSIFKKKQQHLFKAAAFSHTFSHCIQLRLSDRGPFLQDLWSLRILKLFLSRRPQRSPETRPDSLAPKARCFRERSGATKDVCLFFQLSHHFIIEGPFPLLVVAHTHHDEVPGKRRFKTLNGKHICCFRWCSKIWTFCLCKLSYDSYTTICFFRIQWITQFSSKHHWCYQHNWPRRPSTSPVQLLHRVPTVPGVEHHRPNGPVTVLEDAALDRATWYDQFCSTS